MDGGAFAFFFSFFFSFFFFFTNVFKDFKSVKELKRMRF